jgi:hypothetical protein
MGSNEMATYYLSDAEKIDPTLEIENHCAQMGLRSIRESEIRYINFEPLFDLLETDSSTHVLPKADVEYIVLPGAYGEHDGIKVHDSTIASIVTNYVNTAFGTPSYFFYADRKWMYAAAVDRFSYKALRAFTFGYSSGSYILFDIERGNQIAFDDDLRLTFICRKNTSADQICLGGESQLLWNSFFNREFIEWTAPYQKHLDFFNQHYQPHLPGIEIQNFAKKRLGEH